MRPSKLFPAFTRGSSRRSAARTARKSRLAAAERLESRLNLAAAIVDLAAARDATDAPDGYPAYERYPIPAGATLVDVSDSGRYVLFSSTDTNVIAGQQTIPSLNPDLFWLDTQTGTTKLVTHRAGSAVQSAGYAGLEGPNYLGPGYGLWAKFQPLTADLSGDGQSVVFDSIIAANEYDASVPVANDQATYRPPQDGQTPDQTTKNWQNLQLGTVDVFVWRNTQGDNVNNISLVSRLNDAGKQQAVTFIQQVPGLPLPDVTKPMATGVMPQVFLPVLPGTFMNFVQQEPVESLTHNKGISETGDRVLYDSWVPANWIDTVRPNIQDQQRTQGGGQQGQSQWTLDCFVADRTGFGGGATAPWSAKTVSVNKDGTEALGFFQGPAITNNPAFAQIFEPMYSQISGNGLRVVYSTRRTSADIVAGTTDSDLSSDVFANDVDSGTNLLVSRKWNDDKAAAGSAQPNFFNGPNPNPFIGAAPTAFWDSQNCSVSNDGLTIAFQSSAGNLVQNWKNVTADIRRVTIVGSNPGGSSGMNWAIYQTNPIDIYGFRFASNSANVSTGKAALVNTPDGLANTNRVATFCGMSDDGSTFVFSTTANNFYKPGFTSPYPYTANPPQAPLPLNFILGGFSQLWSRKIRWDALATSTTSLVSAGFAVDAKGRPDVNGKPNASGNKATLGSATLPGARNVLNTISATGRFIMFSSSANNLAQGVYDRAFKGGVFVRDMGVDPPRDMVTGRTTLLTTTATGNVPSAGVFINFALATTFDTKDKATPRFAAYVDGTGGNDMQTRFRTEDVAPAPTSHVYRIDYPAVSPAAATTNPAIFTVSGVGVMTRPVLEFRDPGTKVTPSVKTSLGQLLPNYNGEWRTATGDINADGVVDYVYGAGLGGEDTVIVVDGRTSSPIWQVAGMFPPVAGATGAAARPGVFVATADVNSDGFADVIVGSGERRPSQVMIYSGRRGELLRGFSPFGGGGASLPVRVAGGDVDGDGYGDVVAGSGIGTSPARVEIYSGKKLVAGNTPVQARLKAFTIKGGNGVNVAAADMTGDGRAEVIVGLDSAQTVTIYDGLTGAMISQRNLGAEFKNSYKGGVRVAARTGQIMVASSVGIAPSIQLFAYDNSAKRWTVRSTLTSGSISGFNKANTRGVFVG